ncbi:tripartite tricarboxylate transporter substrate binding protein [Bordetella sp. BOR01]|uniref:Bug family tripartite tricarboxylate transporter substrate binding protein n=1 Tax=Bordetella sp. BOR01 TaxID=2854779 RepID=UPI001C486E40|nr:tripartite tricarboxylate transporter substrate binding protein [Bordetella sp. BOR01]MBV7483302.1 tripartite tricarboxylate transporter substrate binding protein [Bordetella sp. BOR01]
MKPTMRRLLCTFTAAAALSATAPALAAYPDQPVKLIVPWPPGGSGDAVGRQVAEALSAGLGQTVYVENQAGASGTIGAASMVRAQPDGYTLFLASSSTNSAAPNLLAKLPYHPVDDFVPITLASVVPSVLIVSAKSPYQSVNDLINAAKARPGRMSYGSGGMGNSGHLSAALFAYTAGIQAMHVPYKGNAPATVDLLGGQIDFMFDNNPVALVQGGKARALATTGEKRSAVLPEVPTFGELGLPGVHLVTWFGLAAPKGTPKAVVDKIYTALESGLAKTDAGKRLSSLGVEVETQPPAKFQVFWKSELDRYRDLIKMSGAKAQ